MFFSVVSSQSSQLGSYFSIAYLLKDKSYSLFGYTVILFCRFSTRLSSAKDLFVDYQYLRNSHKVICFDFFVESIWSKFIFACIYVLFSALSYFFNSLILIEPRPFWAYQVLSGFLLHARVPFFRNIFLSGDGFMALTLASSPPWLLLSSASEQSLNKRYMECIKGGLYLYSTSSKQTPDSKFKKLNLTNASTLLRIYFEQSYPSIIRKLYNSIEVPGKDFVLGSTLSNVVIFPMTTFSETGRCTLEDEIGMYLDFLVSILSDVSLSNFSLLIKPHPGQSLQKSALLLSKLQAFSNIKIHPLSFSRPSLLGSIPLEILVTHLRSKGCNYITLISTSTSAVPISLLFNDFIDFVPAFGRPFLEGLLNKNHLNTRLNQEKLIDSFLSLYWK